MGWQKVTSKVLGSLWFVPLLYAVAGINIVTVTIDGPPATRWSRSTCSVDLTPRWRSWARWPSRWSACSGP